MGRIPQSVINKLLTQCRVGCGVDKEDDALDDQIIGPMMAAIDIVVPSTADAATYFNSGAAVGAVVEMTRLLWDQNAVKKDFSPVFIGLRKKAKLLNREG